MDIKCQRKVINQTKKPAIMPKERNENIVKNVDGKKPLTRSISVRSVISRPVLTDMGNKPQNISLLQKRNTFMKSATSAIFPNINAVKNNTIITNKINSNAVLEKNNVKNKIPTTKNDCKDENKAYTKSTVSVIAKTKPEPVDNTKKQQIFANTIKVQQIVAHSKPSNLVRSKSSVGAFNVDFDQDPTLFSEYARNISTYWLELEKKYTISEGFLSKDHKITPNMRSTLVNWLVDVQIDFKFVLETLYLAVSVCDLYLETDPTVDRRNLQLFGIAALFIAAKYEEVVIRESYLFTELSDGAYTTSDLYATELLILKKTINSLVKPLPIAFLRRFAKVSNAQTIEYNLSKYILELALVHTSCAHLLPSQQAAAACYLAKLLLHTKNETKSTTEDIWPPLMVYHTSYTLNSMQDVVSRFASLLVNAEKSMFKAVREKYAKAQFGKISLHNCLSGRLVKRLAAQ